jgi:hypothetical protein
MRVRLASQEASFMSARLARSAALVLLLLLAALCVSPRVTPTVDTLPAQLTDEAFWTLVGDLSEEGGYFRSDNLISNEDAFQQVIPTLRQRLSPGGVYVGVGPDQNFTYLVAVQPRMAFIVDIRRQNMLLHLMYKALVELSPDRVELLSRLFSRPRPADAAAAWSAHALFEAFGGETPREDLYRANLAAIEDRLLRAHRFTLSSDDLAAIQYVYRAFYAGGPDLRYSYPRQFGGARMFPSYAELMMETDGDGEPHSYLASETNYQVLRTYELKNLVVPVVGDFGGGKALRSIGGYLKAHGATVSLFYTSNVEQYLFQSSAWRRFFDNVGRLPVDDNSAMLRSFFNAGYPYAGRTTRIGRSSMLIDSIPGLLGAVRSGRVQSYYDLIDRAR